MAEEVPVSSDRVHLRLHGLRQESAPFLIAWSECDVERHHTVDAVVLQIEKPLRRACHHEAMQESYLGFLRRTFKDTPLTRGKYLLQVIPGLADSANRHFEQQMVLEPVAIFPHPWW